MLVVPELEKEVELLWELRDMRKVNASAHSISYLIKEMRDYVIRINSR